MNRPESPASTCSAGRTWQRLIRSTRLRINLGWVADALLPLVLAASLTACVVLLLLRSLHRLPSPVHPACLTSLGVSLLLLATVGAFRARRRFISEEEATIRLDAHLHLHQALNAARQGLRPWPSPPPDTRRQSLDGLRWNWPSLALPPLLAALLVALPFLLPAPAPEPSDLPPNEPLAWETMEDRLEELAEKQVADPEDVQEFQRALDMLRQSPSEERFQNASLEATDALQESLERSLLALESNLSRASQALALTESPNGRLSSADRQALQAQLRQAMEGLASPEMALHPDQLAQLRQIDPSALQSLDPATAEKLCNAMRQNAQALRQVLGQSDALGKQWERQLQADALLGKVCSSSESEGPGMGSPTRGPGEAPLHYADQPVDLRTRAPEALTGFDPSRAAPGDLLGVQSSAPRTEQGSSSTSAGALGNSGQGGQETWDTTLLPSERAVLRRYFR